jgi:hypothetical protein
MKKKFTRLLSLLSVFFMLAVYAATAQAVLLDVGPADLPSPPGNGFPFWYRDTNRLALEPCLSQAVLPSGPACVLLADPGFNPALPIVFPNPPTNPGNYPIETFYFVSDAILNVNGGGRIKYRAALEGSFGTGVVTAGGQITFARIRVFADLPVAGTYTFTHPYGVETITAAAAGTRAIAFTRDVGVGTFTGALAGDLGPWLIMTGFPLTIGAETFIGDPNITNTVTGSPFGTNFFRVDGPAGSNIGGVGVNFLLTDQFTVAGKTAVGGLATPLTVDKTTYTRDATTTHVDVFVTTQPISNATTGLPPNPLALANTPSVLQFDDATATIPVTPMATNVANDGKFYANTSFPNPTALPPTVRVTNTKDVPPSSTTVPLVDEVVVASASFATAAQTLTVAASSGDKIALPALTVVMQDGAQEIPLGTIIGGAGSVTKTFPFVYISPTGISKNYNIPPVRVIARSANGGSDTRVVTGPTNNPPVARNDAAVVAPGATVIINVAANDTDPDIGDFVAPSTVAIVAAPLSGTATNLFNGTISYAAPLSAGTATFTYTIKDSFGAVSNVATVTVTIQAPPQANPDTATTNEDAAIDINVLLNDTGTLAPASVTVTLPPAHGTALSLGTGFVRYTPALNYNGNGIAGTDGFSYTVRDTSGAISLATTVSITVVPVADPPLAVNDTATTAANTPVTIDVLLNDTHPDAAQGSVIVPSTLTIATLATSGTATIDTINNKIIFTPALNVFGTSTFTYIVRDNLGTASNPATVTVTITPVNIPPVANNDVAGTFVNTARIINVIANDTDADGIITPGSVVIVSGPTLTGNILVNNLNGTVTYTSPTAGTDTFTYNVKDNTGAVSNNATVTVTVSSVVAETVTVLRAEYTQATRQWLVEGTTTNSPANAIMTIYIGRDLTGQIIGTTTVVAGKWKFQLVGNAGNPGPDVTNTISAGSSPGGGSRLAFPIALK